MTAQTAYDRFPLPDPGEGSERDAPLADEAVLTAGSARILSVLGRNRASDRSYAVDAELVSRFGDPHSYSAHGWQDKVLSLRRDLRCCARYLFHAGDTGMVLTYIDWARTRPVAEPGPMQDALTMLHQDSLYVLAQSTGRPWGRVSPVTCPVVVLELLGEVLQQIRCQPGGARGAGAAATEIGWALASHPYTPAGLLALFGRDNPQWGTVLAHPNFPTDRLTEVVMYSLRHGYASTVDSRDLDMALANPYWDTNRLDALMRRLRPEFRIRLVEALLDHPACPVSLLEQHEDRLAAPSRARLASLTAEEDRVVRLAYDPDPMVRRGVLDNPAAPEHAQVIAALMGPIAGT